MVGREFSIQPSKLLASWLISVHSITFLVVYIAGLTVALKTASIVLVISSLGFWLKRDVFRMSAEAWERISLEGELVTVTRGDGTNFLGKLDSKTVVCPCFIVLCVLPENSRRTVSRMIFPEAVVNGKFREFCVRLKYL